MSRTPSPDFPSRTPSPNPDTSKRFWDEDAPGAVAFHSSNYTVYYLDSAKLYTEAKAFPPPSGSIFSIKSLPEHSDTLDLLFAFVYRDKDACQLEDVEISLLARLADAAAEYQVYSAVIACRFNMRAQHKAHPAEVMAYAAKHGHDDILNLAAPFSRELPFDHVHAVLPSAYFLAWAKYHDAYRNVVNGIATTCPNHYTSSSSDASFTALFIQRLGNGTDSAFSDMAMVLEDAVATTDTCRSCREAVSLWRTRVALESLPLFTTYLKK